MCMAIGGILGAVGSLVGTMAQVQAMNAQAAYHDQQARLEKTKRVFLEDRERRNQNQIRAKQKNIAAISGFELGDYDDQLSDSFIEGELDKGVVWFSGKKAENDQKSQANIIRAQASATAAGGFIGALSPVIKGFGS